MIKHYLKIAWKNLTRNRLVSFINITGLIIGISAFILIMLYVNYEKSYDKFFANSERIYRVYMDYEEGGVFGPGDAQTYNLTGPTLKEEFSEILEYVRFSQLDKSSFIYNDNILEVLNGHLVDPSYFDVFDYPLLLGDAKTVLQEPNSIVLTKKLADKIFGQENPLGKVITVYHYQQKAQLSVMGIIKDIPENTHMKTNFLVSFQTSENWHVCDNEPNWNNNSFFTYVLLDKNVDAKQFQQKVMQYKFENENERHNIESLADIHLNSHKPYEAEENGSADRVMFLFAIALAIIIISWLNYVNLSTTKAMDRAKETGIRKVSGARKSQLIIQFLLESFSLNILATILAFGLVILLLPLFNSFTGQNLFLEVLNFKFYFTMLLFIFIGALLSGLYPAFVLSKHKPAIALKGRVKKTDTIVDIRKGLVVLQFAATIFLLIGTFVISKQNRFLQKQSLGFNSDQVLAINGTIFQDKDNYKDDFLLLKSEIEKLPFVKRASTSHTFPGQGYYNMSCLMGVTPPNTTKEDIQTVWYTYNTDEDYAPLMKLELISGRFFEESDKNKKVIVINERASEKMGYSKSSYPIGEFAKVGGVDRQIVGVIKDYNHFGFKTEIEPMILGYTPVSCDNLLVELNTQDISLSGLSSAIQQLENTWNSVFEKSTFKYTFVDEQFETLFREDQQFNKAFSVFTVLAIFISSMGLFGLALFICKQRTKEIGVRKVNGAKITEILAMLNKEFVIWVVVAFIIASPLAMLTMNKWLENFALKTNISWWIFILSGAIALFIALLTVSYQSWRAAVKNPVEALRYE